MTFSVVLLTVGLAIALNGGSTHACFCTADYKPYCGTDEKTYSNKCELECAQGSNSNLRVKFEGVCAVKYQQDKDVSPNQNRVQGSESKYYPNIVQPPRQPNSYPNIVQPPRQPNSYPNIVQPPRQPNSYPNIVQPPRQSNFYPTARPTNNYFQEKNQKYQPGNSYQPPIRGYTTIPPKQYSPKGQTPGQYYPQTERQTQYYPIPSNPPRQTYPAPPPQKYQPPKQTYPVPPPQTYQPPKQTYPTPRPPPYQPPRDTYTITPPRQPSYQPTPKGDQSWVPSFGGGYAK